jgi:hypothetical protein
LLDRCFSKRVRAQNREANGGQLSLRAAPGERQERTQQERQEDEKRRQRRNWRRSRLPDQSERRQTLSRSEFWRAGCSVDHQNSSVS